LEVRPEKNSRTQDPRELESFRKKGAIFASLEEQKPVHSSEKEQERRSKMNIF
jgi:hypothetical protein